MKKAIEIKIFTIEGAECARDAGVRFKGGVPEFVEPKMNKNYRFAIDIDGDCMVSKNGEDFYVAEAIKLGGRRISVNDKLKEMAMKGMMGLD